jgi:hypothetical protein
MLKLKQLMSEANAAATATKTAPQNPQGGHRPAK